MTDRDLMQQALDALEIAEVDGNCYYEATELLRTRLAQPEQEPVAWITPHGEGFRIRFSPPTSGMPLGWDALYATPPAAPVQPEKQPVAIDWDTKTDTPIMGYTTPPAAAQPLSLEQEREAFESWTKKPDFLSWNGASYDCDPEYVNSYRAAAFAAGWEGWQARAGKALVYTTPPAAQRTWVGLTEDEITECFKITPDQYLPWQIYQRLETKLKEKNT